MRIRFALKLSQLLAFLPFLLFLLTGALAMSLACSGKSDQIAVSGQGDQRLMAMGRSALENKNWTEARGYLQQLLDAYPRSQLAGDARLGIADSYFNQKGRNNLILAIADYRDFLTFFPNHPARTMPSIKSATGTIGKSIAPIATRSQRSSLSKSLKNSSSYTGTRATRKKGGCC